MLCVRVCGADNGIQAAGATALADALKVNTTLQDLNLGGTCARGDPIPSVESYLPDPSRCYGSALYL